MRNTYCAFTPKGKLVPHTNETTIKACWWALWYEVGFYSRAQLKEQGYTVERVSVVRSEAKRIAKDMP